MSQLVDKDKTTSAPAPINAPTHQNGSRQIVMILISLVPRPEDLLKVFSEIDRSWKIKKVSRHLRMSRSSAD